MKKTLLLLILLLLTACTIEPESEPNQTASIQDSTSPSETSESSETYFTLADFPYGAERIVEYEGKLTESIIISKSGLTEYFNSESDSAYNQDYSFTAVRVYYDTFSQLYLTSLQVSVSLNHEEISEKLDNKEITTESISGMKQDSAKLTKPLKIGDIEADGEITFFIEPKYQKFTNTCSKITTYPDGTIETSESTSCDYSGFTIGGGSDLECSPNTADHTLTDASSCKLYIAGDGSLEGTFKDLIYIYDETSTSNTIRTITWSLTPLTYIEEPIYLQ